MKLEEYIQRDMIDFLDMIVRAAIEHDKRSEQEIAALLANSGATEEQKQGMQNFFGSGAGQGVGGTGGNGGAGSTAGSGTGTSQVQAQQIIIQQAPQVQIQQPQQPNTQPIPVETSQPVQMPKPVDVPLETPKPQEQKPFEEPSLRQPGLVKQDDSADPFSSLHEQQKAKHLSEHDMPIEKRRERGNLTADYEKSHADRHAKRRELTMIAHFGEKIDQVRKFIKEKRYGKAIAIHKELQEEAMRIQFHMEHRRRLLDILMELEAQILEKRELLKPIKIHVEKERKEKDEKEFDRDTVYRIKVRKPKDIVEIEHHEPDIYIAKKGHKHKKINVEDEKRFSRFHAQKYKAALHALRTEDFHTAKELFTQLLKERPNNNGLKLRLAQSLMGLEGATHGSN